MFGWILAVLGLAAFEVVSSLDNAVINAQVLGTMKNERAKRFFLTWGIFFAIFVVRGVLPLVIVYTANPSIGILGAFGAMFSSDPHVTEAVEATAPYLMLGGGMFLLLLFLHWFFVEKKEFGIPHFEQVALKVGAVWFHAIAAFVLGAVLLTIRQTAPATMAADLMLAVTLGFAVFFLAHGFKENAEQMEDQMMHNDTGMSDWAKVMFLEIIDLTFSIDGVVGAFAFTTSVPLILIGNGIGAVVVRQLTVGNVESVKKLIYLKNGAMYSIGILASVMMLEGFGCHVPHWVSPVSTFACIGAFLWMSVAHLRTDAPESSDQSPAE